MLPPSRVRDGGFYILFAGGNLYNIIMSFKGFLAALATSSTFGLIPLFTLPLMAAGMHFLSILFYRFLIAAWILGGVLLLKRQNLRVTRRQWWTLAGLSLFYDGSSVFLLWSYHYLSSGVATTINFLDPVFVMLIMIFVFKEKKSLWTFVALGLAFGGVAVLSLGGGVGGSPSLSGIGIDLCSALSYALYIVWVNHCCVKELGLLKLNFYIFSFASAGMLLLALAAGQFQYVPDVKSDVYLTLLALICTVASNMTLVYAVKHLGSTLTSVLGAMESITAVCVGVWVFGEPFTQKVGLGVGLVVLSVLTVVLSSHLTPVFRRFKYFYLTEVLGRHKTLKASR